MKVLVLYYADTRQHFAHHWQYNAKIIRHNYDTMTQGVPTNWQVEHHMFINRLGSWPAAAQELVESLPESHGVTVHVTRPPYMQHKFNSVVLDSYERVGDPARFDRIFMMQHDAILINHDSVGVLFAMESMLRGQRFDLMWYRGQEGPFDYVSHWMAGRQWEESFRHVAAIGIGWHRACKTPLVIESCSQDDMHAEVYLHRVLGERCVYMRPNRLLYFGDYAVSWLNVTRLRDLLKCTTDHDAFMEIVQTAGGHIRGSLHPFLARRPADGT